MEWQNTQRCQHLLHFGEDCFCIEQQGSLPKRTFDDQAQAIEGERILKDAGPRQRLEHIQSIPKIDIFQKWSTTFMPGNVIAHPKKNGVIQRNHACSCETFLQAAFSSTQVETSAHECNACIGDMGLI